MARKYKIVADPSFMTVKAGETVTYRIAPLIPGNADYTFDWEPDWIMHNDSESGRPGQSGFQRGPKSGDWSVKFDQTGRYIIACTPWRTKPDPTWTAADKLGIHDPHESEAEKQRIQAAYDAWEACFYPQCVDREEAFLFDPTLGKTTHTLDPNSVLSGMKRYYALLYQVGLKQFPNPESLGGDSLAAYQQHQDLLAAYSAQVEALVKRLDSTTSSGDIWERHAITASLHLDDPNAPSGDVELRMFLAKRIPAVAGTFRQPDSGNPEWKLVDWTNPVDRGRTGEYDGEGGTDYAAVMDCIKIWSNYYIWRNGNRYPKGTVNYIIPAGVCSRDEVKGYFLTDGSTFWDDLDEFLSWVGLLSLIIVATITLIAPVPGSQLASIALWAGIAGAIAGAAQGTIHLAEDATDDFNRDWKEEAVDVLSIAGCLLGVGTAWARGAAVKGLVEMNTARTIFYGSVAVDAFQGVLVIASQADQIDSLLKDTSIPPDDKIKKLMIMLGQLAGQTALLFVNMKANAKELAHFNDPQPKGPKGKPDLTPAERLKEIGNKEKEIDVSQKPQNNGHTDEGQHTTITRENPYRPSIIAAPPPPPPRPPRRKLDEALKNKKLWWTKEINPFKIELDRRVPLSEKQRVKQPLAFKADFEDGYIHVEMIRTKSTTNRRVDVRAPDFRADELYPWMFEHFEKTAKATGTPVKGIHGEFAFENFLGVVKALENDATIPHPPPGTSRNDFLKSIPQDKVVNALDAAPSWKYWKQYADEHGYTMKAEFAAIQPDDGDHVNWVKWSFALERKP